MGEEEERCVMFVVLVGHNTAAIRRTHAESDLGTVMCLNNRHSCVASLTLCVVKAKKHCQMICNYCLWQVS
jgi:hypothetical protein